MEPGDLERSLLAAHSHPDCVRIVASFFSARELYYGHGTDTPEDEAHWLVAACLNWDDDRWAAPPAPADLARIAALAWRRAEERIPLAYLLGEAWFAGYRFYIDDSVLVPRSPLAEVIENAFEPWIRLDPGARVLEIGTGSGCIAIAAALQMPAIEVVATDVSATALALAGRNAEALSVGDRVSFVRADLFPSDDSLYSVIISNPPYVPNRRLPELPPEYGHEPELGLAGGEDGLDVVRRILAGASARLEPEGVLIVEVGESDLALEAAYPDVPFTWLEFERGGSGVFVLTRDDLIAAGL